MKNAEAQMAASGQVPSAPAAGSKAASKQGNTPAPVSHTLPDFVALHRVLGGTVGELAYNELLKVL